MTYLVLECALSYAVVLSEDGRYLRVPNLGYRAGDTIDHVHEFPEEAQAKRRRFALVPAAVRAVAVAACLCGVLIGGAAVWSSPFGTVRMRINPEVTADVNRFDRVVSLVGDNADGQELIEGYWSYGKDVRNVTSELAERAEDMGFLEDGGTIEIDVTSEHREWRIALEDQIIDELTIQVGSSDTVYRRGAAPEEDRSEEDPPEERVEQSPAAAQPAQPSAPDDGDADEWDEIEVPVPAASAPTTATPAPPVESDDDDDGWDDDAGDDDGDDDADDDWDDDDEGDDD